MQEFLKISKLKPPLELSGAGGQHSKMITEQKNHRSAKHNIVKNFSGDKYIFGKTKNGNVCQMSAPSIKKAFTTLSLRNA